MKPTQIILMIALLSLTAGISVKMVNQWQLKKPPIFLSPFSFPDLNGINHTSTEWKDKILVLNFWATWCPSCLKEIPAFMSLQTKYNDKVQFVGIALDDGEAVKVFQQKTAVNYPLLISGDWAGFNLAKQLGNVMSVIPYTVVINQKGQVIYHHSGELSSNELEVVLVPLF